MVILQDWSAAILWVKFIFFWKCAEATGQCRRRGEFEEPRVEKDGFMEDPFRDGFGALAAVRTTSQKATHTSWRVFVT